LGQLGHHVHEALVLDPQHRARGHPQVFEKELRRVLSEGRGRREEDAEAK
jgi:hypothetical protein